MKAVLMSAITLRWKGKMSGQYSPRNETRINRQNPLKTANQKHGCNRESNGNGDLKRDKNRTGQRAGTTTCLSRCTGFQDVVQIRMYRQPGRNKSKDQYRQQRSA